MVAQNGRLSLLGQVALSTRTDLRAEKDGLRHVEGARNCVWGRLNPLEEGSPTLLLQMKRR
jgi:hypothetical protein